MPRTKSDIRAIRESKPGYQDIYKISDNSYGGRYWFYPESKLDRAPLSSSRVITYSQRNGRTPGGARISNDCNHIKTKSYWFPVTTAPTRYSQNYYHVCGGNNFWDYDSARQPGNNLNLNRPANAGFSARAFDALYPDLETSLSLSNFLIEITDLKHLWRFFSKWKGITSKVAEGHLSYAFGVKPFMEDVKLLYNILTDHQRIIDEFLARRGALQVRYYSEKYDVVEEDSGYFAPWGDSRILMKYVNSYKSIATATMAYTYTCPDLDTYREKLFAILDMLGLRLTPSVIWEAIPFSFVVDWFFRVQDFLEQFEKPLIGSVVTVEDYCESVALIFKAERYWKYWSSPNGASWATWCDHRIVGKKYNRRRCLPDAGNTFINRGQFGRNQLALSASLLRLNLGR